MRLAAAFLIILVTATLSVAQKVLSRGLFLGQDTSDKSASGPSLYRDPRQHAAAVASILVAKSRYVGFEPSARPESEPHWSALVDSLGRFPGFRQATSTAHHLFLRQDGRAELEKVVRDALIGGGGDSDKAEDDARVMAKTVRAMIPAERLDHWIQEVLLTIVVVKKPEGSDTVTVRVMELALTLVQINIDQEERGFKGMGKGRRACKRVLDGQQQRRRRTKVIVPEQMTTMHTQELKVLPGYLIVNAQELAQTFQDTTVQGFELFFASKDTSRALDTWL